MPCASLPLPENHITFDFPPISELTVLRTLRNLPVNKSTADPLLTNLGLRCAPVCWYHTYSTCPFRLEYSLQCGNRPLLFCYLKIVGKRKIQRTIVQFRCYQLLAKPLTRYRPLTFCNIWGSKSLSHLISSVSCPGWKVHNNATAVPDWSLVQGTGEREECHCGFFRLPKGFRPCLASRPTVPTVHLRGIRMEHQMADQLFIWRSNFCSRWIYHFGVQDYLLRCPARLASWSCSFYSLYQQPSIHCEHSHWNLCWWHYPAPWAQQTPFMFNISSSTGGDRLHRRVVRILVWRLWSCKVEDLVDQQR